MSVEYEVLGVECLHDETKKLEASSTVIHAMVDIETLGRKPGCVVHEVAVVVFDASDFTVVSELHIAIDLHDSQQCDFWICTETEEWWHSNGGIYQKDALPVEQAVAKLHALFSENDVQAFWSRGKDFDFPILEAYFAKFGKPTPWKFYQLRCARDLYALAFPNEKRPESKHDALADCHQQIAEVQRACDRLRLSLVTGHESMGGCSETQDDETKKLEASSTDQILAEREQTHGSFHQVAEIAQLFKNVVRYETQQLSSQQQEGLDMICSKIARICNGNPDEVDHWRDIAGYATLVANELASTVNSQQSMGGASEMKGGSGE